MATNRPVLCPNCGAQVRKTGYCSACYMHIGVLKKAYNTSDYYYNVGLDKAKARDLSGAIESLNMSLRYNKKNVMTRNLLGLIYYEMGELVMALSHWVMSVNYKGSDNLAVKYLKHLRQDQTQLDSVDQIAKKFNMALGYAESADYDLAIIQIKTILSANPHFVKGYLLLALLYIQVNNYEKARTTLRRVLKIDKANPLAIHYLHEMGDTDENIIQMRNESVENDGLFEDAYMEEVSVAEANSKPVSDGPIRRLFGAIEDRYRQMTIKTGEFGEMRFAHYSGIYVMVGLVLGILLLFFVVVPAQKRDLRKENVNLTKEYSEELAAKNAEIASLNEELLAKQGEIEDLQYGHDHADNPLPDYSDIEHGLSEDDINMIIQSE
ncbi:MAG: tetratricopeptide repeat protein [Eubacteriales bacterium]|nr:tetratricopeptide repeat protein [Eubacteriales bacterium]